MSVLLIHMDNVAGNSKRRPLLLGVGALALSLIPVNSVLAEGIMVGSLSLEGFNTPEMLMFNQSLPIAFISNHNEITICYIRVEYVE